VSSFAARAAGDAAAEPILDPYELTPLEIASGLVFGFAPHLSQPAATENEGPPVREALERAILPALVRAPCVMSFSGGTASAVVLAVAVQLARREGLEPPVAATNRIEGLAGAHETARQEQVIIRLGLTDWIRFDFADELDLVGPVAMRVLRRHGFLWPSDAYVSMPLIEWAAGGSLITGLGQRNALGEPGGLLCRDPGPLPWLRRSAQREVRARWTADVASRPRAEQRPPWWWAGLRQVQIGSELLRRLGAELRVEICHPLIDPVFTSALGELPANQATADALFGDLLPPKLLAQRPTPTHPNGFWGRYSRALAEAWDGEDVDPTLVDAEALRLQWSLPRPDARTFLLLQAVALARESRSAAALVTGAQPVGSEPGQTEPAGHPAEA
jgi:hypothetical protein